MRCFSACLEGGIGVKGEGDINSEVLQWIPLLVRWKQDGKLGDPRIENKHSWRLRFALMYNQLLSPLTVTDRDSCLNSSWSTFCRTSSSHLHLCPRSPPHSPK